MKIPIKLYQRCMAKVSSFWLIRFVFHATAVTRNHSKDSKFLQLVCKLFTRFWISKQASGSEYVRAHNMPRLWILICEGYTGCWICLNKSEYALMIFQYAWLSLLTLNMIECGGIYLKKKKSAEYARILNVPDAVHSRRLLYKWLSSYRDRDVLRTLSSI